MNANCNCRHCNNPIEFDQIQAGCNAPCPHCGLETVLFVPSATPKWSATPSKQKTRQSTRSKALACCAAIMGIVIGCWIYQSRVGLLTDSLTGLSVADYTPKYIPKHLQANPGASTNQNQ